MNVRRKITLVASLASVYLAVGWFYFSVSRALDRIDHHTDGGLAKLEASVDALPARINEAIRQVKP